MKWISDIALSVSGIGVVLYALASIMIMLMGGSEVLSACTVIGLGLVALGIPVWFIALQRT